MIRTNVAPALLASAFLNRMALAGVVPSGTQRTAVAGLIAGLDAIGLDKFFAVYPLVGGTAVTHALDLLGAFQMTWSGGLTHNANGVTGDNSNHGSTGFVPATHFSSVNDIGMTVYQRTAGLTATPENTIGVRVGSTNGFEMHLGRAENLLVWACQEGAYNAPSPGNYQGTWTMVRRGASDAAIYRNGASVDTSTAAPTSLIPHAVTVLAVSNAGTPTNFSDRNLALASIHAGLSGSEVAALHAAVLAFQTTLGRAI